MEIQIEFSIQGNFSSKRNRSKTSRRLPKTVRHSTFFYLTIIHSAPLACPLLVKPPIAPFRADCLTAACRTPFLFLHPKLVRTCTKVIFD
jgi:hypothetical protein